jgi:hypothetical protein
MHRTRAQLPESSGYRRSLDRVSARPGTRPCAAFLHTVILLSRPEESP